MATPHPHPARACSTVAEILADLGGPDDPLSRRTCYEWRAKGTGPKCVKLPNGELRVRRAEYRALARRARGRA